MTTSQPAPDRAALAGRRARRAMTAKLAILATAERLLEERPFADISVDDLAKGAGLSRPTFYFYFPSKDAVLLTLFERVIVAGRLGVRRRWPTAVPADPPRVVARRHQRVLRDVRSAHARWRCAGTDAVRATNPEIRELLVDFMQRWIDTHRGVDRGRARPGRGPDDAARTGPGDRAEPDERAGDDRVVRRGAARRARGPASSTRWRTSGSPASTATSPLTCQTPMRTYVRVGRAPPSCTPTSIRSTPRSSSVTIPRCAAGR